MDLTPCRRDELDVVAIRRRAKQQEAWTDASFDRAMRLVALRRQCNSKRGEVNDSFAAKPFDVLDFRAALGSFATGVTIVTSAADGRLAGVTCNSFASLSLEPPLVLWSLAERSSSRAVFEEAGAFTVNILSDAQEDLALRFARSGGDKFGEIDYEFGRYGIPRLKGCLATFECRTVDCRAGGDHLIFIGAVETYAHAAGAPLLFARGRFRSFDAEL